MIKNDIFCNLLWIVTSKNIPFNIPKQKLTLRELYTVYTYINLQVYKYNIHCQNKEHVIGNWNAYSHNCSHSFLLLLLLKKGRQCKAEREWYTPYQSEDPSPTIPTYRQKEEKLKKSRRL